MSFITVLQLSSRSFPVKAWCVRTLSTSLQTIAQPSVGPSDTVLSVVGLDPAHSVAATQCIRRGTVVEGSALFDKIQGVGQTPYDLTFTTHDLQTNEARECVTC